jgi:general secretion pathway protein L
MRSIGIDIGRYSIKVVEIFSNQRNYEITQCKEYSVLNHKSNDQEIEILQCLKQISEEFDTDSARVISSVRQQYVSTRKLFFPFRERVKIQKSLAFELEDDMPISIEKAVYDSKIIGYKGNAAEVIAMACVTEEVANSIELLNRAHVDPEIICPEMSAISNLYESWHLNVDNFVPTPGNEQNKMILHLGHSKSFMGILSQGRIIWGRSLLWGADKVATAIAKTFQVPISTALEMMPEKAFLLTSEQGASKDQIKMSDTVAKAIEPLVQACRLTKILSETELSAPIVAVDVLGLPSHIKNLLPYLTEHLEIPVNHNDPLNQLKYFKIGSHHPIGESFQMAVGLAIEGLKKPYNPPINFRQLELAKKNQSFEKLWDKWGYSAKIIAAAYFLFFIYSVSLDVISTHLEETSNDVLVEQAGKIANLNGANATPTKIRAYIRESNKKAKLVEVFSDLDNINSPIQLIGDISQSLPSNKKNESFDVRHLFVYNDKLDIQGVAIDDATIKSIEKALKALSVDGKVNSVSAKIKNEANKKTFAFNIKVKRKN